MDYGFSKGPFVRNTTISNLVALAPSAIRPLFAHQELTSSPGMFASFICFSDQR